MRRPLLRPRSRAVRSRSWNLNAVAGEVDLLEPRVLLAGTGDETEDGDAHAADVGDADEGGESASGGGDQGGSEDWHDSESGGWDGSDLGDWYAGESGGWDEGSSQDWDEQGWDEEMFDDGGEPFSPAVTDAAFTGNDSVYEYESSYGYEFGSFGDAATADADAVPRILSAVSVADATYSVAVAEAEVDLFLGYLDADSAYDEAIVEAFDAYWDAVIAADGEYFDALDAAESARYAAESAAWDQYDADLADAQAGYDARLTEADRVLSDAYAQAEAVREGVLATAEAGRDDAYSAADPLAAASYDALDAAEREYWEALDRANEALWRAESDAYEHGTDTSAAYAEYAAAERAAQTRRQEAEAIAWDLYDQYWDALVAADQAYDAEIDAADQAFSLAESAAWDIWSDAERAASVERDEAERVAYDRLSEALDTAWEEYSVAAKAALKEWNDGEQTAWKEYKTALKTAAKARAKAVLAAEAECAESIHDADSAWWSAAVSAILSLLEGRDIDAETAAGGLPPSGLGDDSDSAEPAGVGMFSIPAGGGQSATGYGASLTPDELADLHEAEIGLAQMLAEIEQEMQAEGWTRESGGYGPTDGGAYGKEIEKRLRLKLQGGILDRIFGRNTSWNFGVVVDPETMEVLAVDSTGGQHTGAIEIDLVYTLDGHTIEVGETLDRGKIEVYELKSNEEGRATDAQRRRLRSVSRDGEFKEILTRYRLDGKNGRHPRSFPFYENPISPQQGGGHRGARLHLLLRV